ncbi:MAG: heme biosynthesis HemY N-terminal domain-containing protein [Rhizomicrobium sp.]|jgi:HemY protein
MTRVPAILALAGLVGVGLAWLVGLHGMLTFTVNEATVMLDARSAAALAIALVIASAILGHLLWLAATGTGAFGLRMNALARRRGTQALSRGLLAAAAGDLTAAGALAYRARALLGEQSLCLLLAAQVARLENDDAAQADAWNAMLARRETVTLGLRGLYVLAMRRDDLGAATSYVNRALELDAKTPWAIHALFDLNTRQRRWTSARTVLKLALRAGATDAGAARRSEAVLLTAEACDAERRGDSATALSSAQSALALCACFAPAATLAARLLLRLGRDWQAQHVLAAAWSNDPNPELANGFAAMRHNEPREVRAQRLTGLAHLNRDHFESRLLFAEHAMTQNDCGEARRLLAPFAHTGATTRLCAMMTEIELLQGQDAWAMHAWSSSAARALPDASWSCGRCGAACEAWDALCANCGGFDTLAWPSPSHDHIAGSARPVSHLSAARDERPEHRDGRRGRAYQLQSAQPQWHRRPPSHRHALTPPPDSAGPGGYGFDRSPV